MARRNYEKRAFGNALITYLGTKGWSGLTYSEGYGNQHAIKPPQIAVTFPPSRKKELQLGRTSTSDAVFNRVIQVDAYMETEMRADAIIDDIMDFIDLTVVVINDPSSNFLGTLICQNTESIFGETLPPITNDPKIGRYRGVVKAQMEAHYPNG